MPPAEEEEEDKHSRHPSPAYCVRACAMTLSMHGCITWKYTGGTNANKNIVAALYGSFAGPLKVLVI